jgi:hypothetical protein
MGTQIKIQYLEFKDQDGSILARLEGKQTTKKKSQKKNHKKHYVPYTNDVRTPKVTTTIEMYAVAHPYIHGFELTEDKTIPTKVLRHLAKNEWFTKFEPHPFEYEE